MFLLSLHMYTFDGLIVAADGTPLVVSQPSTGHQLLCVQVYVWACNCFVWYLL